jgi:signal transduction histidine kinase
VIGETAATRNLRIAAIATGFGSIVFGLLALGDIQRDASHLQPWFVVSSVALFFALPVLLVPLGWWGSVTALRWVARTHTLVVLAIVALWTPATLDGPLPDGSAPWVLNTLGVVAGTAVVGWRSRIVWPYLMGVALAGAALRYVGLDGRDWTIPLEDGLSILEVSVVLAALLTVTISAGRSQDVALAAAVNDARGAADADSRARQRARFGSLVHDDVITTLLAAAQATRRDDAIARSAERAIAHLDRFIVAPSDGMPLDAELLEVEVRAAVTEVVDGVEISGTFSGWNVKHGDVPGRVALAMTGALGEAARNSVRHAGPGYIHRKLILHSTADRLTAELRDDGRGFEPDRVMSDRLGIRSSVVGNMMATGGEASVISAPGAGARVVIAWSRQQG